MIVSIAQINPISRDLTASLALHCKLSTEAALQGSEMILFPEMSLTGYTRSGAAEIAFTANDKRLDSLYNLSEEQHIVIALGLPLKVDFDLFIATLVIFPDQTFSYYLKQHLHEGEEYFFKSGPSTQKPIAVNGKKIWFCICSDITHPQHFTGGYLEQCHLFAASIFYSEKGMEEAYTILEKNAASFETYVIMCNFSGNVWNLTSGGRSAVWNPSGESWFSSVPRLMNNCIPCT